MDLTKMDITQLKALVYDENVKIEIAKRNIQVLIQEITKKTKSKEIDNESITKTQKK